MEKAAVERIERRIDQEMRKRFPGASIDKVVVLQYGDDPEVEPGDLLVRVLLTPPEGTEGTEATEGTEQDPLDDFLRVHRAAIKQARSDLYRSLPEARRLEFTTDLDDEHAPRIRMQIGGRLEERGADLTPVMARLDPIDLETLDTLITTGIAANRADAVRWTLARIRERPAYAELRERARQIEDLKTQF
ncbi:MAG TPA: hypothetical protein VGH27_08355 [Streptosporangiaceae bacterium]|jgi:hypothetical protein